MAPKVLLAAVGVALAIGLWNALGPSDARLPPLLSLLIAALGPAYFGYEQGREDARRLVTNPITLRMLRPEDRQDLKPDAVTRLAALRTALADRRRQLVDEVARVNEAHSSHSQDALGGWATERQSPRTPVEHVLGRALTSLDSAIASLDLGA